MCHRLSIKTDAPGARFVHTDAVCKGVHLVETDVTDAQLINCTVYGLSAWDVRRAWSLKEQTGFRIKLPSPIADEPRPGWTRRYTE